MLETKFELVPRCSSFWHKRRRLKRRRTCACSPSVLETSEAVSRLRSLEVHLQVVLPSHLPSWDSEDTDPTVMIVTRMRHLKRTRMPSGNERRCEQRSVASERRK
jgi:hypothetical protein